MILSCNIYFTAWHGQGRTTCIMNGRLQYMQPRSRDAQFHRNRSDCGGVYRLKYRWCSGQGESGEVFMVVTQEQHRSFSVWQGKSATRDSESHKVSLWRWRKWGGWLGQDLNSRINRLGDVFFSFPVYFYWAFKIHFKIQKKKTKKTNKTLYIVHGTSVVIIKLDLYSQGSVWEVVWKCWSLSFKTHLTLFRWSIN